MSAARPIPERARVARVLLLIVALVLASVAVDRGSAGGVMPALTAAAGLQD